MSPEASQSGARTLEYPFSLKPALGETIEVAPGVLWIRMTLPYTLNHINLWALEDGNGWAIVDTGVRDQETTDAWRKIFANGFGGRPVTRVFVTHMHPDHVGMAGWLVRRGVEPENEERHLHHLLMMEGVAVEPLLAEALAMIRRHHDGRRPARMPSSRIRGVSATPAVFPGSQPMRGPRESGWAVGTCLETTAQPA